MKLSSILAAVGLVMGLAAPVANAADISGAGATFPFPIYAKWADAYKKETGNGLNYQSIGSGAGIKQIVAKTVTFGATDAPMTAEELKKAGLVQWPMVMGGIVPVLNVEGIKPGELVLDGPTLANIFLGTVKTWDDAAIKKLNPKLALPSTSITVVRRSDGSGTTAAFTESLQSFSKEWTIGNGKSVSWKVGVGGKGNEGVSGTINTTDGSIGYVNQSFVKGRIKAAAVQNKAGEFVLPTAASGAKALATIKLDKNLAGTNPNPSAKGAYPIATLTYLLFYAKGNGEKAESLRQMITFILSDKAQALADDLGYVPLRDSIQTAAQKAVARIKE